MPLAMLALVARRWHQLGAYPPGVDQGHWLAIGRAYLGQGSDTTRLFSSFAVPPAIPVLLNMLGAAFGSLEASRIVGAASIGVVVLGVWVVSARYSGPWLAGMTATLLGFSILIVDPAAWGGYPQNFALAGLACASYFLGEVLSHDRDRKWLVASSLFVALSHHALYGVLLGVSVAIATLWFIEATPSRARCRRIVLAAGWLVPSALVFALVLWSLERSGYEPAVNAGSATLSGTVNYAFPEPRLWWYSAALLGAVSLPWTLKRRAASEWKAATSLVVVGAGAFAATVEPRFLSVAAAGLSLALAFGCRSLESTLRSRVGSQSGWVYGVLVFLVLVLSPSADQRAAAAFEWFAVVDKPYSEAAHWIEEQDTDGAVAIRTDNRGWPIGWWLRGLTTKTILVGSDARWLGFPAEAADAAFVGELFAEDTPQLAVARLAHERHVKFLAFNHEQWRGWERWTLPDQGMRVAYTNARYTVIEID